MILGTVQVDNAIKMRWGGKAPRANGRHALMGASLVLATQVIRAGNQS